jgi:triosephosphate isomerase
MRKPIIIGNWKMNTNLSDAVVLTTDIKNHIGSLDIDVVLCPPSIYIYPVAEIVDRGPKNLEVGAQNIWFAEKGAMTGEISATMLKGLAKYVILGHSERRSHFAESDTLVNDKIQTALKNNLTPIVCVGEIKKMTESKNRGRPTKIDLRSDIFTQLKNTLKNINRIDAEKLIIAYEPVWAIGTGNAATGAYASDVIEKLRDIIAKKYNKSLSERIRILYGGSVDSENVREYIYQPEIDGVLVGGSSLKSKEFIRICKEAAGRE